MVTFCADFLNFQYPQDTIRVYNFWVVHVPDSTMTTQELPVGGIDQASKISPPPRLGTFWKFRRFSPPIFENENFGRGSLLGGGHFWPYPPPLAGSATQNAILVTNWAGVVLGDLKNLAELFPICFEILKNRFFSNFSKKKIIQNSLSKLTGKKQCVKLLR